MNDWSGIDETRPRAKKSTMQMRSSNPANEQKAHASRVEGLPVKLEIDGNLPEFYESATRRLQTTGLDTIAYARDPYYSNTKPTVMVIKNHAQYTSNLEHNIEKINDFAEKNYDEFDQLNDNAAQEFLFNSISDQLRTDLQLVLEPDDCFVSVYLRLMDLVVSVSSAHYDKLREAIRHKLPKHYPKEDVKALCDFYKESADELHRASQFNPTLILDMLNNLSTVSVTGSFPFDILSKHREVKQCLDSNAGLPVAEIEKQLLKSKLNYVNVLKFATKAYNDLLKDSKWPPAQSLTDPGNKAIAGLHHAATPESFAASVLALVQQKMNVNSGLKEVTCYNCGEEGHIARDCPRKKKNKEKNSTEKKKNWKRIAPKDGEEHTKKVGKRTFYWCAKCNRWSTTHGTDTHVKKEETSAAEANLIQTPGIWCFSISDSSSDLSNSSQGQSFSSIMGIGYFVMTYLFMVLYLVRNDLRHLCTIFRSFGFISFAQSFVSLLHNFGGFTNIAAIVYSFLDQFLKWVGPACAPLLWFCLGLTSFWIARQSEKVTTVEILDSKMHRRTRRTYERRAKKQLKSQMRKFRPTPILSPRVHGTFIRRRSRRAPTISDRQRTAIYNKSHARCNRTPSRNHHDHRWKKLCRTHLKGIRQPYKSHCCPGHFTSKVSHSCFNANSSSLSGKTKESTFQLVWDSGASVCITHDRNDFIDFSSRTDLKHLNSVGGEHDVKGVGMVLWSVIDTTGMLRQLRVKAYYVPTSRVRLLSLHALLEQYEDEGVEIKNDSLILSGSKNDKARNPIKVMFHPVSRLPIIQFPVSPSPLPIDTTMLLSTFINPSNVHLHMS